MTRDFQRSLASHDSPNKAFQGIANQIDLILVGLLALVIALGLVVLRSAVDGDDAVLASQAQRLGLGFVLMLLVAQLPPSLLMRWAPFIYLVALLLLVLVEWFGVQVKGSQRWLEIPGVIRFQPSELMKIALPLGLAWYLQQRQLPPSLKHTLGCLFITALPVTAIAAQPDLGTSILVFGAGLSVMLLAGLYWRWVIFGLLLVAAAAPFIWRFVLHDYQRGRILTLIDPQSDPLGAGWNIIQSTTAIGSGGLFGKGLFQGTQSYLDFLPEARTDFIVAVMGEELGFVGISTLLLLYLLIIARGLVLATQSGSTFGRLVSGSLVMTFFVYLFVNIGMVSGILPVVGVPLPLVSYGGTSALTLMVGFGIIMSVRNHKAW